jgi:hypothetical protein
MVIPVEHRFEESVQELINFAIPIGSTLEKMMNLEKQVAGRLLGRSAI